MNLDNYYRVLKYTLLILFEINHDYNHIFPLLENEIINYSSQMTRALAYIHDLKVLHRDMKPANVMIDQVS